MGGKLGGFREPPCYGGILGGNGGPPEMGGSLGSMLEQKLFLNTRFSFHQYNHYDYILVQSNKTPIEIIIIFPVRLDYQQDRLNDII